MKMFNRPKPTFSEIPKYGDHMTIKEWLECVECGGFIDYDGYGDLATINKVSDITICPSEAKRYKFPDWCTHIMWYNR